LELRARPQQRSNRSQKSQKGRHAIEGTLTQRDGNINHFNADGNSEGTGGPLLIITRVATRDTELSGVPIPAGSAVMPMLGAANRDEDRYPVPDRFDIFRSPKPHISFGHGVHACLGMHLARLEMRVALDLLLDRLPGLHLDPEGKDPHIRGQVFRSPTSLPVLFGTPSI